MKTVTLRTLVRDPLQVKRWTRRGVRVQVTDRGQPLWVIQAAEEDSDEKDRQAVMEGIFEEVLREPESPVSLSKLVKEGRR